MVPRACSTIGVGGATAGSTQRRGFKQYETPENMQRIKEYLEEQKAKEERLKNWKPGERKRELAYAYDESIFDDLDEEIEARKRGEVSRRQWTLRDKRCGALAIKVGMMPVWDDWGERHACTVLFLDRNVVMGVKSFDGKDGYDAVVLGAGGAKAKNVNKPLRGIYEKCGVGDNPPDIVREFRIASGVAPPEGTQIHARHFLAGQNIDVAAISKGKGFQGGMKRHNFSGMPASHGVSRSHRALGSTGQCQDPGRVFKGKKMAGRMGGERVTVQNLRIVKIDRGRNLIYVKGAVPGQKGAFVEVRDSVKKPLFGTELVEGGLETKTPPLPTHSYDDVDGCGEPGYEIFMPPGIVDPLSSEMVA